MRAGTMLRGVVLSVMLAGVAFAADVAGKWKAEFSAPDGQQAQNVFTFAVDGEKLTGTVYSSLSGNEAKIEEGTVKGDDLSFAITRNFGGTDIRLRYKGKVSGDQIAITVTADQGFEIQMTAKREKP
jgi:opacity protein-like surface antigen